jgi:L-alanine-DL-glutamate epimerase-like enolase superfamily enzyme
MRASIITACGVGVLHAPLIQPFRTALGQHDTLDNLCVTLTLADGTKGYGEAAVATHITGETIPQTEKNLRETGAWLCGRDAADYTVLSGVFHERMPDNKAAVAALEMAVLDALTRSAKMPLWALYGSAPAKVRTDITVVIDTLDETVLKTKAFYAQGFRAFKVKIGRDEELDLARVRAVAKIAKKAPIFLDANQGYTAQQTLRFLKDLDRCGIVPALVEQPVPKEDWEGLKRVTRLAKTRICADESVKSLADAVRAVKEKAVHVINIKLMKSGLVQAREIAHWARGAGMGIMMGGMMESALAMSCSAHLAAGLGGVEFADLDTPFFLKSSARPKFLSPDGVYDLSQVKAGIGVALR